MNGKIVKGHVSTYPNPVTFEAGDVLQVGAQDEEYPGWIWVVTGDGNQGWAPLTLLALAQGGATAKAKADYCAHELDVVIGESVMIGRTLCGWHFATKASGESGWVPQACVATAGEMP